MNGVSQLKIYSQKQIINDYILLLAEKKLYIYIYIYINLFKDILKTWIFKNNFNNNIINKWMFSARCIARCEFIYAESSSPAIGSLHWSTVQTNHVYKNNGWFHFPLPQMSQRSSKQKYRKALTYSKTPAT